MCSLLSQSQTPTAPRRAVGFFRFGCPAGCPAWLITQSTSGQQVLFRCPFRPSTRATLTESSKMSTQTIGAMHELDPVNNGQCNLLQHGSLLECVLNQDGLYTKTCTPPATRKILSANQRFILTQKHSRSILLTVHKEFSDVRTRGLCGRWFPGQSRAIGYWGGHRRLLKRPYPHLQVDRTPR